MEHLIFDSARLHDYAVINGIAYLAVDTKIWVNMFKMTQGGYANNLPLVTNSWIFQLTFNYMRMTKLGCS